MRILRLEASDIGSELSRNYKATDMNFNTPQAVIYLAKGARVMSTWNGWKKAGVVNGAQETVYDRNHREGQGTPNTHIAILVRFRKVSEPKENDEVAHQQLPSNVTISFEARTA